VIPGKTYHIKMVIQDKRDTVVDSAVFLEGGSFDLGTIDLGDDLLVENENALCAGESRLLNTQLDVNLFSIKWFKDGVEIQGATGNSYNVTESGEYTVEAVFNGTTCLLTDKIKVEIYPKIEVVKPNDIEVCVVNGNFSGVDLTIDEALLLSQIPDTSEILVSYHQSTTAAQQGIDKITTPNNFKPAGLPKEIFVRVFNSITGCYVVTSFNLLKKGEVKFKKPANIVTCVYNSVASRVDLTSVEAELLNGTVASSVKVTYYETLNNAENGVNPIAGVNNYQANQLPKVIFVQVLDPVSGCKGVTSFEIVESPRLTPVVLEDVVICDRYVFPAAPVGHYYSTEEFGEGEIIEAGKVYGEGKFPIYVNIKNNDGCVFSSHFQLEVIKCSVPKGISPNGDGLNDAFDLTYYKALEVVIYNRYGSEVYMHGPGYTNQWFGQSKDGKALPEGTYYYKITTATEVLTGYVQVVREVK